MVQVQSTAVQPVTVTNMSNTDIDDTLRKIFVGGLDYDSTENTVREYFESWGPLSECSIKRFPDGRSRGFAFVTFCSLAAMEQCIATNHIIDGKSVDLRRAATGREENEEVLRAKEYDPEAKELKKLFVGNLDFETVESELETYFSQYGEIESISIGRAPDGKSRGYCFVNYDSAASVDRVQETRPHSLGERKVETKRATPKHLVGKPEANVSTNKAFIGPPEVRGRGHSGLSEDITDENLKGYFGQFGTVLSIQQMVWDDSGKKRGYGYVEFSDDDAVDKIVLVRTHIINGRELEAKKCLTKQQMKEMENLRSGYGGSSMNLSRGGESRGLKRPREAVDPEAKIMRKLFVGNLDPNTSDEDLEQYFSQYGEIENVTIHKFPDTGKSRGFGFVTFSSSAGVDNVQSNRPHELSGQKLDTKRNLPKTDYGYEEARVTKIYIGAPEEEKNSGFYGLNENTSDEDLEQYFGQFGSVIKVEQLVWRDSGKKRGYGYIEFEDEDAVDKVVLIGIHTVKDVKLEACKAIDKNSMDGGGRGVKRSRREVDLESAMMRKLFVRNLSSTATEDQLKELFGQFGEIEIVQLPLHADSGKPKGFAFITFQASSAVDSVQQCRPHRLDGYVLETSRATPKEDLGNPEVEARSKKIFIGGLDEDRRAGGHSGLTDDITDADLESYFSTFGKVLKVDQKVWEDTNKKRGYGYIDFEDEDAVDKIVLMGVHTIKGVRLLAKKGLNKEQIRRPGGGRDRDSFRGRGRGGGMGGFQGRAGPGDMKMMQDRIMSLQQNMGGPGGKKGGDKSMAMMSSMQKMMLNMMSMCNHMMGGQGGQGGGQSEAAGAAGAGPSGWESYQQSARQGYSSGGAASRYNTGYSSAASAATSPAAPTPPGYPRYGGFGQATDYSGSSQGYSGGYSSSGYGTDTLSHRAPGTPAGYTTSPAPPGYSGTQGYSDYSSPSYAATWSTGGPGPSRGARSAARDPRANPYSRN